MSIIIKKSIIGSARAFHITWSPAPIDRQFARKMRKVVFRSKNYSAKMITAVKQLVQTENKIGSPIALDTALSVQHTYTKAKVIQNHYKVLKLIKTLALHYKERVPIMELSKTHDLPPLSALKHIWKELGVSKKLITKVFVENDYTVAGSENRDSTLYTLSNWDLKQFKIAYAEDIESYTSITDSAKAANIAENKFVDYFRSQGIALKSEKELIDEQTKESVEHC